MSINRKADIGTIAFQLYKKDADKKLTKYIGVTQVDLPDITFLTQTISGAGIAGNLEVALMGQMDAMEVTVNFTSQTDQVIDLAKPELQEWTLKEVQGYLDKTTNAMKPTGVTHVMQVIPKSMTGGSLQANNASNPTVVATIYSWKESVYELDESTGNAGTASVVLDICPAEYRCQIGTKDYLANIKNFME